MAVTVRFLGKYAVSVIGMLLYTLSLCGLHAQAEINDYKLTSNDLLDFRVFQEPDLDAVIRISGDGNASFPLIGTANIAGKSIGEAIELLNAKYKDGYLVSPQVSITVRSYAVRRFTVLGQVQKPGSYEIEGTEEVTLLQAIGLAGGYTRISDPSRITVKRRDGAAEKIFRFNGKKMAKDDSDATFVIHPGDVITVAESVF